MSLNDSLRDFVREIVKETIAQTCQSTDKSEEAEKPAATKPDTKKAATTKKATTKKAATKKKVNPATLRTKLGKGIADYIKEVKETGDKDKLSTASGEIRKMIEMVEGEDPDTGKFVVSAIPDDNLQRALDLFEGLLENGSVGEPEAEEAEEAEEDEELEF